MMLALGRSFANHLPHLLFAARVSRLWGSGGGGGGRSATGTCVPLSSAAGSWAALCSSARRAFARASRFCRCCSATPGPSSAPAWPQCSCSTPSRTRRGMQSGGRVQWGR
eukprot:365829-Chlamydomonas_euryale.AAC.1